MQKTWIIADNHFGDANIIKYEKRPFSSVEEMDETMVCNWNNTVSDGDKVFVLGDFALAESKQIKQLAGQLHGYKILILGNHDCAYSASWWLNAGFQEVSAYPIIFEEFYIFSHEPVYINENMPYANIFGHVHGSPLCAPCSRQSFCVSAERIDYTPIDFNEVKHRIKSMLLEELGKTEGRI